MGHWVAFCFEQVSKAYLWEALILATYSTSIISVGTSMTTTDVKYPLWLFERQFACYWGT